MSNKKRKVTFDPEPLPSSESSPPLLLFGHFPPIVSKQELDNIQDVTVYKSILKNSPTEGKAYDSLCNFLIDLPPPPEEGLLSLDVLQPETLFKPKNRFGGMKDGPMKIPIFEEDSCSSEDSEDDSITEYNIEIKHPNAENTINEDDLIFHQPSIKPKSFEASLILEQSSDDRLGLNKFEVDKVNSASSEIRIEPPWISETNIDLSFASSDTDIEFTDISKDTEESKLSPEPIVEEIIVAETYTIEIKDIPESPIEYDICQSTVHVDHDLDRRRSEEEENTKADIPLVVAENKIEQVNPNIRKLDEEHNELFEDFKIVNKRNKIIDDSSLSENIIFEHHLAEKEQRETSDIQFTELDITDATIPAPASIISLPSLNAGSDHDNNISDTLTKSTHLSTISDSQLNIQTTVYDSVSPKIDTPLITTVVQETANTTNAINDTSTTAITSEITVSARHRRKSARKIHRKHSHASRSAVTTTTTTTHHQQQSENNSTNINNSIITPEQKALDAQARFKRYLGKMSAKAMNENQNLNCAGEPETLEPHMRDSIKESQVLIWIYNMIDEAARVDFEFFLKDGCILCKLMNRVVPDCIPESEITWEGARSKQRNINNFLKEAEKYGVPKAKLFFAEDLLQLRHIPRVTRCIYALAKIAQTDPSQGHDMPQLGDEPSFLKEASKFVVVPGHRDTKDVLAQLTASKEDDSAAKKTKHSLYK